VVSIFNCSPGETRYCLPPVRMTAYIAKTSSVALVRAYRFLHELCCMGRIQKHCIKPTGQANAVFQKLTAGLKPVVPATLEI
jgi:hypothetical protein